MHSDCNINIQFDHFDCNIFTARVTAGKDDEIHPDREQDPVLAPEKEEVEPPPRYRVVLLNDDYTPMEFVVDVLRIFFGMNLELATRIMLQVHTEGKGVCGVFPRDIAESKATLVNDYARENQHPLMSDIEIDQ